jgi:hypothetical protein
MVVALVLSEIPKMRGRLKGNYMKPVWLGIIFVLVYGLFSMKSQATTFVTASDAELRNR